MFRVSTRRNSASVWCAFVAVACSFHCGAESAPELFDTANKLYYEGKFNEAVTNYEKLLHSGQVSPAIYFNMGNAWLKSGQIGRSIAAYEKGKELAPRDPDIRANLQFARAQVQGPSYSMPRLEQSLGKLTLNEWTFLASVSIWLLLLLLIALQLRGSWRRGLRVPLYVLAILSLSLSVCVASALYQEKSVKLGVIIARETTARRGPLEESQTAFVLNDGTEVRVLDQKNDWLLITTDPRRSGWIRQNQILLLK